MDSESDFGHRFFEFSDSPQMEVEAEATAYLVARRNGLKPKSEKYLSNYKDALSELNVYDVVRAAHQVEIAMGIPARKLWKDKVNLYGG